jgi:hypothetical protein
MAQDLLDDWLINAWEGRRGGLRNPPSISVLDACRGHFSE